MDSSKNVINTYNWPVAMSTLEHIKHLNQMSINFCGEVIKYL